jgi:hypothetical protein
VVIVDHNSLRRELGEGLEEGDGKTDDTENAGL